MANDHTVVSNTEDRGCGGNETMPLMRAAAWGLGALAVLTVCASVAVAQPPPRPPPKPGFVPPPENSAGLYPISGEPVFKARCAGCHEPAVDRAPDRKALAARSPEEV